MLLKEKSSKKIMKIRDCTLRRKDNEVIHSKYKINVLDIKNYFYIRLNLY
jgi:hypothetical protein